MRINITNKEFVLLLDLERRLVENYNSDSEFQQREEDRLVVGNIIDKLKDTRSKQPTKATYKGVSNG